MSLHRQYPTRHVRLRWITPGGRSEQQVLQSRYQVADFAVEQLRCVREIQAPKAADAVARAMKSVEGARRHAIGHGWDTYPRAGGTVDLHTPPSDG